VFARVFKKLDKPDRPRRPADETIVQIDRHHFGMFGPFLVEQVETIRQITRKSIGGAET
jgi:hypothetical protein